ncbi:MAG: O-methyltransferase, partial [Actinobacteria bacterium]|nr:O-methyltransferase [Actinomycetota bacterium]
MNKFLGSANFYSVEEPVFLKKIREQAELDNVPLIEEPVGKLLYFLIELMKPKNILEIGCGTGYSTLWMAQAIKGNGKILAIDSNKKRIEEAIINIEKAGYQKKVNTIWGNALKIIPELNKNNPPIPPLKKGGKGGFDFIFIDAAKSEYLEYLRICLPLLNIRGLIVADNILMHTKRGTRRTFDKGLKGYLEFSKKNRHL